MEAGRSLISSSPPQFPLRTHLPISSSSSTSVLLPHEQSAPSLVTLSTTTMLRHPPTSVIIQDQQNGSKSLLKEENIFRQISDEESNTADQDEYVNDFQLQLLRSPDLTYLWPSLCRKDQFLHTATEYISSETDEYTDTEAERVVAIAREALFASKEAASIVTDAKLHATDVEDLSSIKLLANAPEQRFVRSTRLPKKQRRSKLPTPTIELQEVNNNMKPKSRKKIDLGFDASDPLRLFLRGSQTTQLLTAKEESDLIQKIQELMKLQAVKTRLQAQFSRDPTMVEWASALGISSPSLRSQLHYGNISRHKLIYANFRMVVHIAKQYQGRGLSLQDLMQAGSMGLIKSVEKFKPQVGCRFATYSYWWIRQGIRKAIFQHSRTIRLPENVYALLGKVYEAKKSLIQKGIQKPSKEDVAACTGMTVERLDKLLCSTRVPISMERPIWRDQDTTYQEVTADTSIESPEKKIMRQHVRNLLCILNPRERKVIRLRFGIEDGKEKTLSEIGDCFGLSKERIRQLESRALYKLKQCLSSQGLAAYSEMLM